MRDIFDPAFRVLHRMHQSVDLLPDRFRALDDALGAFLAAVSELPGASRAALYLNDPQTRIPVLRAAFADGVQKDVRASSDPFGLPEATLVKIMAAGAPVCVNPRTGAVDLAGPGLAAPDQSRVLAAPGQSRVLAAPIPSPGEDRPAGCLVLDKVFPGEEAPETLAGSLAFLGMAAEAAGRLADINRRAGAEREALRQEILSLRAKVSESFRQLTGVGSSRALERLRHEVERAALSDLPVLIHGPDGAGRNVAARVTHELSSRASRPFCVTTRGGSDPEALAVELFGGLSGDPAEAPSIGLLESADGGSIYLREPQTYPPSLQKKLAMFLESGVFFRQGDEKRRQADVRVMAGTTREPSAAAPGGKFFEALLGLPRLERIHAPSLAERSEDIPALVNACLGYLTRSQGQKPAFTPAALKALESYDWPGNIRELEDVLTRIVIASSGDKIDLADIPPEILSSRKAPAAMPGGAADLRDIERRQIEAALSRHDWNQSRAARELGLTLRQIGYRIKKYGLSRD